MNMSQSDKVRSLTFLHLFRRWEKEVLPARRCEKWERLIIKRVCKFEGFKANLIDNSQRTIRNFRDYRLHHPEKNPKRVKGDSVNRELNLISSIITYVS